MKIDIPHPDEIDSVGTQIVIHSWDTWSMDHTLSYIIVPMLKQLKETKHGAPAVEFKDVPEELMPSDSEAVKKLYTHGETDDNYFKRWDYVLDEMIWAFTYKRDNFDTLMDKDPKAVQARMSNGFRLFGKYYESLWD
jgi:hypothetical protein